jgi:hypothetical protein
MLLVAVCVSLDIYLYIIIWVLPEISVRLCRGKCIPFPASIGLLKHHICVPVFLCIQPVRYPFAGLIVS